MEVMEGWVLIGVAVGYLVAAITAYTVIGAFLASALPFEPSPLRNAVSRKTFLPTVLHFAEQHQQAASGRGC